MAGSENARFFTPATCPMKREGQLVRWESARGFGFIRSPDVPADVFVHSRDFVDRSISPKVGMALQFEEIHVGGKGPRAVAVKAAGAVQHRAPVQHRLMPTSGHRRSATTPASSASPFVVLGIGYAAVVCYGVSTARIPPIVMGIMLLVSLLTFFIYRYDKNSAETGRWRVSERSLHLLSLLGGWPGAWCAQRLFRHKVRKASFMTVYWATVVLHIAATTAWAGRLLPAGFATP